MTWTLTVLTAAVATSAGPTDADYLQSARWNDGKAEVAFYRVERDIDHYGNASPQSFLMGTYLVKHDFDRARQAKARVGAEHAVSAFKWAAFYEFESDDSYQFKHSYVVNAAQADLAPLKASFTSFDWCSNQYRELAFTLDGRVERRMRSDDYGNVFDTFEADERSYPVALVPVLVRALDFSQSDRARFQLLLEDGTTVAVEARFERRDLVETGGGMREAERIRLVYASDHPSLVSRHGEREETYWRAPGGDRALLAIEASSYRVTLVEQVRSAYWEENVFRRLSRVEERP